MQSLAKWLFQTGLPSPNLKKASLRKADLGIAEKSPANLSPATVFDHRSHLEQASASFHV